MMMSPARVLCAVLITLSAATGSAEDKRLHWRNLNVSAHLDREGRLHVLERQTIVFNGDWNGGERNFNLRVGQELELAQVSRIDQSGKPQPLTEGSLESVDEWSWHDSRTLRWRTRLPSDPPHQDEVITYLIDYTITNVVRPRENDYVLRHEFAFPDREGIIEHLAVNLTFDDAWKPLIEFPGRLEKTNLKPGDSATVEVPLRYALSSRPEGVERGAPAWFGWLIAAVLVSLVTWMCVRHFAREARAGVFLPLVPLEQINNSWLEKHLFKFPPEVVGAVWDNKTSGAEVAAVLARMTLEGKMSSRIEKKAGLWSTNELYLTLLVPRERLSGYEASLVKAMFVSGDQTSTTLIREHYKDKGFDPVAKIRGPVERLSKQLASTKRRPNPGRIPSWKVTVAIAFVSIALLVSTALTSQQNVVAAAAGSGIIIAFFVLGVIGASVYRGRVTAMKESALLYIFPVALILAGTVAFLLTGPRRIPFELVTLAGLATFAVAAVRLILATAALPDVGERFLLRRQLAAAREYFKQQLRSKEPALTDGWFPYLLAFGLGPRIDRWFRAFGNATGTSTDHSSLNSYSGSSVSRSGSGWTGGGGAFGGAGASGSWAVAAGAMASGVSTPGSSGGSGGFSSGGGSSGGGGGGGW